MKTDFIELSSPLSLLIINNLILYIRNWNQIYVIVSIILIIVALSNYLQKSSECNEIIFELNREGEKLEEESKVINEKIDKYNRQISLDKQHENLPNSRYTQQIENMISDLKQISKINNEKIKMHNNKAESLKEKCNLAIEYREKYGFNRDDVEAQEEFNRIQTSFN